MPRKGHSEEKILFALRQVEGGKKVGDMRVDPLTALREE